MSRNWESETRPLSWNWESETRPLLWNWEPGPQGMESGSMPRNFNVRCYRLGVNNRDVPCHVHAPSLRQYSKIRILFYEAVLLKSLFYEDDEIDDVCCDISVGT